MMLQHLLLVLVLRSAFCVRVRLLWADCAAAALLCDLLCGTARSNSSALQHALVCINEVKSIVFAVLTS